ncbi:MAG: hypothetical protein GY790_07445 [Bacteroidetes bacterium]|nr:hypothetical protein [Bacteroidota bacterium]
MLRKSILSYQGQFSFSTVDKLLSEFKIASQEHEISFRIYKKMISVMIEALENVTKYSDQFQSRIDEKDGLCPTCYINYNTRSIELITTNPVQKRDVEPLRSLIDNVNKQNKEELKDLYRSTITNGEFSPKGGAGLGFIEMAKTTGNKLEYTFKELQGEFSLYTFRVVLDL